MTSNGNNFNVFFLRINFQISCSLNSIKTIPKMFCFVTILWSQSWGAKVHGAPTSWLGACAPPDPLLRRRCQ